MQQHWAAGQALHEAMASGDLTAARRAAATIAEVEDIPGLLPEHGPYLERMRDEAASVSGAQKFDDAAMAAGRMAARCGDCHIRGGYGPQFDGSSVAPAGQDGTSEHMIGHTWAMDRMWEGMIGPSLDRWKAGARVLANQPISAVGMSPDVGLMAARVHELGRLAMDDANSQVRGERFGEILTNCASCHAELGIQ
jgi:mono/diheme cytochrome c family protein